MLYIHACYTVFDTLATYELLSEDASSAVLYVLVVWVAPVASELFFVFSLQFTHGTSYAGSVRLPSP